MHEGCGHDHGAHQHCGHDHGAHQHTFSHGPDCPFCKISLQIENSTYEPVYADEVCMIIHDLVPQSKHHLLVIPRFPVESLEDLTPGVLYHLLMKGFQAANRLEFVPKIIINQGAEVGKIVEHLHIHFRSS